MRKIDLQECKKIQLQILDEIVRICKENDFQYSLAYGSMIGAVRHKGYIPWDDDIDIYVYRKDYDKLIALLKDASYKKADWVSVIDDTCDGYYYSFAKVVDDRTEVKLDRHVGNHGIWVDIFPLDNMPKSKFGAKAVMWFCSFLRVIALAMDTNFSAKTLSFGTLLYKRFFYALATVIGKKRICRFMEWVFHRYENTDSNNVANLFTNMMFKGIFKKDKLLPLTVFPFEDREYTGFADYDYYLSQLYGDYMQLPPEEKRITHNFDAWWKE